MNTHTGPTAKRAGLTTGIIAKQATKLTETHGLTGWSIRDLARALDVVPSVIYHYFPKKDDLYTAVISEVCRDIALPDPTLEWKQWFRELTHTFRPVFLKYRGVTELLAVGKITPEFLPIIDQSCAKLLDAGFGPLMPMAYSIIFNSAVSAINARNLRHQHPDSHSLTLMMQHMSETAQNSEGLEQLITNFYRPLAENEDQVSDDYFTYMIDVVLDGVEHVILPQAHAAQD